MVVEANFIRADGYNLAVSKNLNFVPRQFLGADPTTDAAANTFLSVNIPNPFRNLVPGGSQLNTATTITRAQSLLAFNSTIFGSRNTTEATATITSTANQQTVRDDLTLTSTYTYSNLRGKVVYLNPTDTILEDRISQFDRPHRFTFAGSLSTAHRPRPDDWNNMHRFLDAFVGGWQLNGTYEWQSGEPFVLT